MKILVTSEEMQKLDSYTITQYGIPSLILMENAGRGIVDFLFRQFSNRLQDGVLIVAGPGNNGGDGFVIARHLYNKNIPIDCVLLTSEDSYKNDALINLNILKNLGIVTNTIICSDDLSKFETLIRKNGIVIDAIFGTGLKRKVEGHYYEVIKTINNSKKFVISVDIPSGVCASTGKILGIAIKADITFTLGFEKVGLRTGEGQNYVGEIHCIDISIPENALQILDNPTKLVTMDYIEENIKRREKHSHKGSYGHAGILAGSDGKTGAAVLACMGALYSGAGLVTLISTHSTLQHGSLPPEIMTYKIHNWHSKYLSKIIEISSKFNAILLGPGMGTDEDTVNFTIELLKSLDKPLVLDADALTNLSKSLDIITNYKGIKILTPHPGEMARLTGLDKNEINSNRVKISKEFSKKYNCTLVLKGAGTVIATSTGKTYINPTGNPYMATGGSGDVLAGMIVSLLAQGYTDETAAILGAYIHGLSADLIHKKRPIGIITPTQIAENIPYTISTIIS